VSWGHQLKKFHSQDLQHRTRKTIHIIPGPPARTRALLKGSNTGHPPYRACLQRPKWIPKRGEQRTLPKPPPIKKTKLKKKNKIKPNQTTAPAQCKTHKPRIKKKISQRQSRINSISWERQIASTDKNPVMCYAEKEKRWDGHPEHREPKKAEADSNVPAAEETAM